MASGSNADIRLSDIDWKFCPNRASVEAAGCTHKFQNTMKYAGIKNYDFDIKDPGIGCAALVLTRGIFQYERDLKNLYALRHKDFKQECLDLQVNCAFDVPNDVTLSEFESFIGLYPNYRVVIYSSLFGGPRIYAGPLYESKSIYIYHCLKPKHYVFITSPKEFFKTYNNNKHATKFCETCAWYSTSIIPCLCSDKPITRKLKDWIKCPLCNRDHKDAAKHKCELVKCRFCSKVYNSTDSKHRCPLYSEPNKKSFHETEEEIKQKAHSPKYKLWFYDIESHFIETADTVTEFQTDSEGNFIFENGSFKYTSKKRCDQLPNYLYAINGFTNERYESEDPKEFLNYFLSHNQGYNILIAHNGSGYDTRLLFSYLKDFNVELTPILKGTKFMQLKAGPLIFRDTLFHLTMSLSSLAKAFNLPILKGHFPHTFSTLANLEYSGPIPDKEYFDLRYSRTQEEIDDFHKWHDEWDASGKTWNYREQRKLYCINDVEILKDVAMQYHYGIIENLESVPHCQVSPWFFPTMAGHMHKICLLHTSKDIDLETVTPTELSAFTQKNAAVLYPTEHFFVKEAMRG